MPETYYLMMRDIMESLIHWGFKNFMFINMHAGECGTSVMLYLHPEYVDLSKTDCIKMDPKYTKYPDIVTYTEFGEKTPNGILGDATLATREKGEAIR